MKDLNLVTIGGRLTRDPEVTFTPSGTGIAKLGLASSDSWKDKNTQEWQERTTFVDVTFFKGAAEYIGKQCYKGQPVTITGSLRTDQWEDKQSGQKRSRNVIDGRDIFLHERIDKATGQPPQRNGRAQSDPVPQPQVHTPPPVSDDDVPF